MNKIYLIAPQSLVAVISILMIFLYSPLKSIEGISEKKIKQKQELRRETSVPILLYHNINGKGPYSVTEDQLRKHFEFYRNNNIKVISLRLLLKHIDEKIPFKGKVMVITFDDGYPSTYSILKPLTEEFKYPVTLFVYVKAIHNRGKRTLTWKKLKKMDRGYIDIQCHSFSHSDLVKGLNEGKSDLLYRELVVSRKYIEMKMNKKIDFFAFPYGRYNLELLELCNNAGYTRTFSTEFGPNIVGRNNYCLRRHHIKNSYSLSFIKKLID